MKHPKPYSNSPVPYVRFLLILLYTTTLLLVAIMVLPALARSPASACNPNSETWVRAQIKTGELDLSLCPEDQRVLSADRLKTLLTQPLDGTWEAGEPRIVVRIKHAIFTDQVNLQGLTIWHRTALINCQFREGVNFSHSLFLQPISFRGSSFTAANFSEAEFKDRVDFHNARFTGLANFEGIRVGGTAFFSKSTFIGAVQLQNATISRQFQASGTRFMNDVVLDRIHVGGTAFFNDTVFEGDVRFQDAVIDRQFQAQSARFRSQQVSFKGMRVSGVASFTETIFWGSVTFRQAEMHRLEAVQTQFNDADAIQDFGEIQIKTVASFDRAAFSGAANFQAMQVGDEAIFNDTHFAREAFFNDTVITNDFWAVNTRFTHPEVRVLFEGMQVGNKAEFKHAVFVGPVSFDRAKLHQLVLSHAVFGASWFLEEDALITHSKDASFKEIQVTGTADFWHTNFWVPVTFSRAELGRLEAKEARFHNEQLQDFSEMRVTGTATLSQVSFAGDVTFQNAVITGDFRADKATFSNKDSLVFFKGMRVGNEAIFQEAEFRGPVIFKRAELGRLQAQKAKFYDQNIQDFGEMRIQGTADFTGVEFTGPVYFQAVQVGNDAIFGDAQFSGDVFFKDAIITSKFLATNATFFKPATFAGMKADNFDATKSVFKDTVDFNEAIITSKFLATNATFSKLATFTRMKVGNFNFEQSSFQDKVDFNRTQVDYSASFTGTSFNKQLDMRNTLVNNLSIDGNHSNQIDSIFVDDLDLSGMIIQRDFSLQNIKMYNLKANFIQVGGPSLMRDLTIWQGMDLSNSSFHDISLCNVNLSQAENVLKLHGMAFKHIGTPENADCKGPWTEVLADLPKGRLLPWIFRPFSGKQVEYSPSFYANLETFFMSQGEPDLAEDVFITQKWHERSAASAKLKRLWNIFIHITVGDGRRPELAFLWGAIVVLIGCLIFARDGMEPSNPADKPLPYNRLWYSLDVFTPVINLKSGDRWQPCDNRRYAQIYVQIHTFLGWILIPVGLAAFAGIIQ